MLECYQPPVTLFSAAVVQGDDTGSCCLPVERHWMAVSVTAVTGQHLTDMTGKLGVPPQERTPSPSFSSLDVFSEAV